MKVNDIVSGLGLLAFAIVLWLAAQGLPNPARQVYGPAFFPQWIAVAMGVAAVVLLLSSLHQIGTRPFVEIDAWLRDPVRVLQFLMIPGAIFFYVYCVDYIGFLLAAILTLGLTMLGLGVRIVMALPLTLITIGAIYATFDMLLRVPLPRGTLFY